MKEKERDRKMSHFTRVAMKLSVTTAAAGVLLLATLPSMAAEYTAKVSEIQPNHDTQDCIFFRLDGVTNIWPASPGNWFTISRSSLGAMEAFTLLLTSRVKSDLPVKVTTTGAMACGHAEATYVSM